MSIESVGRIGIAAFALTLAGCGLGDDAPPVPSDAGPLESRTVAVADFNTVTAVSPDRVIIRRGDAFAVGVRGRAALLDRLDISRDGSALRIRREGSLSDADANRLGSAVITITMPRLNGITLAGSGEVIADQVDGPNAALVLAGSGDMRIANAAARVLDLTVAGSGDITITGRAERSNIHVLGSGSVNAATFGVRQAEITVAGSGDIAVQASQTAEISMVGSGDVTITGGATCTTNRRGSGNVSCGN
jgi:hypothetical protein